MFRGNACETFTLVQMGESKCVPSEGLVIIAKSLAGVYEAYGYAAVISPGTLLDELDKGGQMG